MAAPHESTTLLNEQAFERLRADIIGCQLAPGQILSERRLTAELGLGMAAVRVALTRLSQVGLVRAIPRKGYQVLPLTMKSVDDLFEFWGVIGPELVGRAAHADETDLQQAIAYARELADMTFDDTPPAESARQAAEIGGRLFGLLAEMSDNQYLIDAHHRIIGEAMRIWTFVVGSELHEAGRRVANFEECIDALQRRDQAALTTWMHDHVQRSHDRVRRTISRWPVTTTQKID